MAGETFNLTILTPQGSEFEQGNTEAVIIPGMDGYFGILARHAPLIAAVSEGVITVTEAGKDRFLAVTGGIVEVSDNSVFILADIVEEVDSAEAAKEKAAELSA
jgi:F-type H+-transporting ATPase subunit epsilon